MWRRHLINDIAPVAAVVASSGKYVVAMDEWLHFGDLPIVIYGARGDLIAVHNLEEIVNPFDGKYDGINLSVVPSISGPNWPAFAHILRTKRRNPVYSVVRWDDSELSSLLMEE